MSRACSTHGRDEKNLVGKAEGKRQLGRPTHGWKNYIRLDLREIGWEDVDWIHVAQDRD
jgi:hypothetical protein